MEVVWKVRLPEEYWQWKFLQCPFETSGMVTERRDGGIVAFHGFISRPTKLSDGIIAPLMCVDAMADPEHRGGSAYGMIMNRIKSEVSGKRTFFGFTSPVTQKVFGRYFKDIEYVNLSIPVFTGVLNLGYLVSSNRFIRSTTGKLSQFFLKLRFNLGDNGGTLVRQDEEIGSEFDDLWADVSSDYFWIQNRGQEFIKWRYRSDPTREYQIWKASERGKLVGYLVTTINRGSNRNKGLLIDWLVCRERQDVFEVMVKTALSWFIGQKVDVVTTWLAGCHQNWARFLRTFFFVKREHTRSFVVWGGPEWDNLIPVNTDNFFITIGDSDYLGLGQSSAT